MLKKEESPAEITKKAQRAILHPEGLPVIRKEKDKPATIVFSLKNVGQTVAVVVSAGVEAFVGDDGMYAVMKPEHPLNKDIKVADQNVAVPPNAVYELPVTQCPEKGDTANRYQATAVRARVVFRDVWGEKFELIYKYRKQNPFPAIAGLHRSTTLGLMEQKLTPMPG